MLDIGNRYPFSFAYLRGNQGFMIDSKELRRNPILKKGLVWITLSGMIKGQKTPTLHHLWSVPITSSGINVELWRDRLLFIHQEANRIDGPAICEDDGYLMSNSAMNDLFWTILEELYEEDSDDFPNAISSIEDIRSLINIYRTMRRTSNSRALAKKVGESDIKIIQRWRNLQTSRGKAPGEEMQVHYAEQELLNECFRRYTYAM